MTSSCTHIHDRLLDLFRRKIISFEKRQLIVCGNFIGAGAPTTEISKSHRQVFSILTHSWQSIRILWDISIFACTYLFVDIKQDVCYYKWQQIVVKLYNLRCCWMIRTKLCNMFWSQVLNKDISLIFFGKYFINTWHFINHFVLTLVVAANKMLLRRYWQRFTWHVLCIECQSKLLFVIVKYVSHWSH